VDGNSIGLILPRGGFGRVSWFFLFFSAFWNAITWILVLVTLAIKHSVKKTLKFGSCMTEENGNGAWWSFVISGEIWISPELGEG
jgi:hypothetical protein